jgi:hypothetical protein
MHSSTQKSQPFANRSPWSDIVRGGPSTPLGKPPRSPASPYIYYESTVTSPTFGSTGTKTRRSKRKARTPVSKDHHGTPQSKAEPSSFGSPSPLSQESVSATKTPKQEQDIRTYTQTSSHDPDSPALSSLSLDSKFSAVSDESTLNASSQAFVPSYSTMARLNTSMSDSDSITLRMTNPSYKQALHGMHQNRIVRLPEGDELQRMVSVLLKIVDDRSSKTTPRTRGPAPYPLLPTKSPVDAFVVTSGRATVPLRGNDDYLRAALRAAHEPLRRGARTA